MEGPLLPATFTVIVCPATEVPTLAAGLQILNATHVIPHAPVEVDLHDVNVVESDPHHGNAANNRG